MPSSVKCIRRRNNLFYDFWNNSPMVKFNHSIFHFSATFFTLTLQSLWQYFLSQFFFYLRIKKIIGIWEVCQALYFFIFLHFYQKKKKQILKSQGLTATVNRIENFFLLFFLIFLIISRLNVWTIESML